MKSTMFLSIYDYILQGYVTEIYAGSCDDRRKDSILGIYEILQSEIAWNMKITAFSTLQEAGDSKACLMYSTVAYEKVVSLVGDRLSSSLMLGTMSMILMGWGVVMTIPNVIA